MEETILITSSWWSGAGLTVYALFLALFLMLTLSFIIFAIKPQIVGWTKRQAVFQALIMGCFCAIIMNVLLPYFFEFNKIKITADGSWVLQNGWNIPLAHLDKTVARDVVYGKEFIRWYGATNESGEFARLYVVTDTNIYPSPVQIDQEKIMQLTKDLNTKLDNEQVPLSNNQTPPFSIYKNLQTIRYGTWLLVGLVMLSPLVIFKKGK